MKVLVKGNAVVTVLWSQPLPKPQSHSAHAADSCSTFPVGQILLDMPPHARPTHPWAVPSAAYTDLLLPLGVNLVGKMHV